MELERTVGLKADGSVRLPERPAAVSSILLKLAAMGVRIPADNGDEEVLHLAGDLFARYREQTRLLSDHLCPADGRIQHYIDGLLADAGATEPVRLPAETFILDRYGLARELSLPIDADTWHNELVSSYRLDNGVLHNPVNDRRTTQGVFHVAEGGLPIPADKTRVPLAAYVRLLRGGAPPAGRAPAPAVHRELARAGGDHGLAAAPAAGLSRGAEISPEKRMEVRFFVARRPGLEPRLRREHLRQRRRSVSARERCRARRGRLDRPHRLRDPGAASHAIEEEGPRPPAGERRHPG